MALLVGEGVLRAGVLPNEALGEALGGARRDQLFSKRWLREDPASIEAAQLNRPFQHDAQLGWTLIPGLRDYWHSGAQFSTNTAGMRGAREVPVQRTPGTRRVLLVGDSFAFGEEQSDQDCWAASIEALLPATQLLNFGVPGYGCDQALLMLERQLPVWSPDAAIFCIFADDVLRATRASTFYLKPQFRLDGEELRIEGTPVPPPQEFLSSLAEKPRSGLAGCFLVRLARSAFDRQEPKATELSAEEHFENAGRLVHALLERATKACQAQGIPLLVVWIPTASWHRDPPDPTLIKLRVWTQELDFALLDMHAEFQSLENAGAVALYRPGGHFTLPGSKLMSARVAQALRPLLL